MNNSDYDLLKENDWRERTTQLLEIRKVILQKQLHELLISEGFKISYQRWNDYVKENSIYKRKKLFDSSNAYLIYLKGASISRLKDMEYVLLNSYLINNGYRSGKAFKPNLLDMLSSIIRNYHKYKNLSITQFREVEDNYIQLKTFIDNRNKRLRKEEAVKMNDSTLLNSLYSRTLRYHGMVNDSYSFILPDKTNSLDISKLADIVVDIQTVFEEKLHIEAPLVINVVCITKKRTRKLEKEYLKQFNGVYHSIIREKRKILSGTVEVKFHSSGLEKYVANIEKYQIS